MSIIRRGIMTGRQSALLVIFLIFIYLPGSAAFFNAGGSASQNENRNLAQMPEVSLNLNSLKTFPEKFEKYYNDNFGFRHVLTKSYNWIQYCLLGVSPTKNIVIGKNDWLFYGGEPELVSYRNMRPFTDLQMTQWRWNMTLVKNWLENRGIGMMFIVAPNKSTMYPEYMPDHINRAKNPRWFDQVAAAARGAGVEFIDPRKDLFERKKRELVYHRTDTHWNDIGGFIGYTRLANAIHKQLPAVTPVPESSITFETIENKYTDLVNMMGLPVDIAVETKRAVLDYDYKKQVKAEDLPNSKLSFRLETGNPGPRALMFRDSFSERLIPFLSKHFSHITAVWDFTFLPELVEKGKPDIVIYEMVERSLMIGPGMFGKTTNLMKSMFGVIPASTLPFINGGNKADPTVPEELVRYAKSDYTPNGVIMFGPYTKLPRGNYRAVFRMKSDNAAAFPVVKIEITADKGKKSLGFRMVKGVDCFDGSGEWKNIAFNVVADREVETAVEFKAEYLNGADIYIESVWFERADEKPLDIYEKLKG